MIKYKYKSCQGALRTEVCSSHSAVCDAKEIFSPWQYLNIAKVSVTAVCRKFFLGIYSQRKVAKRYHW